MRLFFTLLFILITFPFFAQAIVVINDDSVGPDTTIWTKDNIYHLDGYVFVEHGGVLIIEPGTIIKGLNTPSTGDASSALIITRGAKIIAQGTADDPIIFTAEFDDISNPSDLTKNDRGLWGGLLILGYGIVGVNGDTFNVEGIPSIEGRATYGGTDNDDNSGILEYVSIRHGGSKLEANNEINGLTLAGVGRQTEINHIEVYANLDDGIEWFGGAVNVKHAVVAFPGDDSFDFDQSWDGKGQFWFSIQDEEANRAGEWDGSERSDLLPKVSPVISNATFIGGGSTTVNPDNNDALRIRNDGAARVYNTVMTGFARRAIGIDDNSWQRFLDGDITFTNNVFSDFASGSTLATIVSAMDVNALVSHLDSNANVVSDPAIAGISRIPDGNLDPRVNPSGAAYGKAVELTDPWFSQSRDIGAFENENWAERWTALDEYGFFGDLISAINDPVLSETDETISVYPNPLVNELNVSMQLPREMKIQLNVIDISGRMILQSSTMDMPAGSNVHKLNVSSLPSGVFALLIESDYRIIGKSIFIKN